MNLVRKLIVTGLGTGYLRPAGTWGSLGACLVFLGAAWALDGRRVCVGGAMLALAAAAAAGCVALGPFTERAFGGKDPNRCTIDEWAGQAVSLVMLPLGAGWADWLKAAGVAFAAFRVFDIVKPPPVRRLERIPGGLGIVADDIAAGVYANVFSQLALLLLLKA